ncbi:DUF3025 domain-containing protein [Hydrogenophaga sp.]|uniref:DUF3025 domain-containing protein n=1 Tax=Hydrogenophaga sp. TaxID=1904254 RepID=UPI003F6D8489
MGAPSVDATDWPAPNWPQPWYAPFCADGAAVRQACEAGVPLPQALTHRAVQGPRFIPQAELPAGVAYEAHIYDTGTVPTREGLHDFFNGLCWMRFPLTKRRLNQLQATEIAAAGVGQVRGPVRDGLTLFDENAALLQAPDALWDALVARDWTRLFVELRPLWAQARLVLFGHALLEKLVVPYKSITAHVVREPVPLALGDDLAAWDGWLAGRLSAAELATKPFTPLPVLGVPGWCPANEDPTYYADAGVFRPKRVVA